MQNLVKNTVSKKISKKLKKGVDKSSLGCYNNKAVRGKRMGADLEN